jgi:hypothetical protein
MSQAEVPKLVEYVLVGSESDEIAVPKLVMYVLAVPSDAGDDSNRQGHVHTQIVRR